ncbi:general stress protein CsbD [Compostibacter hankyongensis]|uniref:General stress protein CsbD n=1 Tax=Compostibacter hankyongensis TaxID=1007089 RepID=A0ABP8FER6_9BACT
MDARILNRKWRELKWALRQRYIQLTDEDVLLIRGEEEQLMERLQHKLGKNGQELNALLADLILSEHCQQHW